MRNFKPLAALALTAAGSALVVGFQVPDAGAAAVSDTSSGTAAVAETTTGSTGASSGSGSASSGSASSGTAATATVQYADGTYLGAAVDEPWGSFQVQATVSGGQLVDVTVVAAPTDGHSSRINSASIPALTSEALAAQSADVDVISGATWTSESYATSLQAALDDAAAALDAAA
jgi:uncharacterized protein with FMN-binding domain